MFGELVVRTPADVWTALGRLALQVDAVTTQNTHTQAHVQRIQDRMQHMEDKVLGSQRELEKMIQYAYTQ